MDIENPISPQNPLELRTRKTLIGLLTSHQRRVLAYIHTLVPNPHDAEDIYQAKHAKLSAKSLTPLNKALIF